MGRTIDLAGLEVFKELIMKSGGWQDWKTVLIYLYGGCESLLAIVSDIPETDFVHLKYLT